MAKEIKLTVTQGEYDLIQEALRGMYLDYDMVAEDMIYDFNNQIDNIKIKLKDAYNVGV